VSVCVVNGDYYHQDGRTPAEERGELLPVGMVRVFVLSPDAS
jgi:hypothetical protein